MRKWIAENFDVEMHYMAPGEKLSELELLKHFGSYQWRAIADALGRPPQEIVNDQGERLYGSVINFELDFGSSSGPDVLCEGEPVFVRNGVGFFAKRFVEGFFAFGNEKVPETTLDTIRTREDLMRAGLPYAYMTNAFIARAGGNSKLKVYMPAGFDEGKVDVLAETPAGIVEHRKVQATGIIPEFGSQFRPRPLEAVHGNIVRYQIVPENDLNGAGLLYFARYLAMMNYAERVLLTDRLSIPVSHPLTLCFSTDQRRAFLFGNAGPFDAVDIDVRASLLAPGDFPAPAGDRRWRTPFKLQFRFDLYRSSDKVLMASSLVRKSLNVPADQKGVLMEADRLLAHWT